MGQQNASKTLKLFVTQILEKLRETNLLKFGARLNITF